MKTMVSSLFLALIYAFPAWADVKIEEASTDYELRGLTTNDIHENIIKSAPREENNIVDAEIKEDVTFTVVYKTEGGSCRIASDEVKLEIASVFPRWVDRDRAADGVRTAWEGYAKALRGHEDGHKAIAVKAANAVDALIHAEQGASTCDLLKDKIAKAAEELLSTSRVEQDNYDGSAPSIDIIGN